MDWLLYLLSSLDSMDNFRWNVNCKSIFLIFQVVVACSIIGTFAFKDSKEKSSNPIPTFVTIFGLVSVMFCIIIIPIDIFNVSHIENPFIPQIIVRILYFCRFFQFII